MDDQATRVLVVEDEDNIAFILKAALRLAGFEVDVATTGRSALDHVEDFRPHLIVMDVMLPDLDGFEVCRRLRSNLNDVPIIFLTARDNAEDRLTGLTIGGDDYLTKPFNVEELIARAKVVLRRAGRAVSDEVMRFDDLELDDSAHLVTRGGVVIALSPTEYKLLRYLLASRGRVLTRSQILDHVWNYDFDGEATIVESFVSSLRRKLDSDGASPIIHTVRGVGYRLGTP